MLKIKQLREQKSVSRYKLWKKTGIAYNTLVAIENGGDVRLSTMAKIAEALGVSVIELFDSSSIKEEH